MTADSALHDSALHDSARMTAHSMTAAAEESAQGYSERFPRALPRAERHVLGSTHRSARPPSADARAGCANVASGDRPRSWAASHLVSGAVSHVAFMELFRSGR